MILLGCQQGLIYHSYFPERQKAHFLFLITHQQQYEDTRVIGIQLIIHKLQIPF